MSTKFSVEDEYFTHHRMTVDFWKHLDAFEYSNDWKLSNFEYYLDDEQEESCWKQFGIGDNVQAFEEKFDIFSMLNMTKKFETRNIMFQNRNLTLIRSERHQYTQAWYAPKEHFLSGVALQKSFAEHTFSLIKFGRRGYKEVDVNIIL